MTPELVKKSLAEKGMTISQWARMSGFSEVLVYAVLAQKNKATRGTSHQIAVALGLKKEPDDLSVPEFIKNALEKDHQKKRYQSEGNAMT
jgi:gp16 family phage-associated protein